jgi:hypothetical protein
MDAATLPPMVIALYAQSMTCDRRKLFEIGQARRAEMLSDQAAPGLHRPR